MILLELHPEVATRSCADCKAHVYDETTGKPRLRPSGAKIPRPAGARVKCQSDQGCPVGTPENPRRLTAANAQAYLHYRQSKAVGHFPDDSLVRQNAATIDAALEIVADAKRRRERMEELSWMRSAKR